MEPDLAHPSTSPGAAAPGSDPGRQRSPLRGLALRASFVTVAGVGGRAGLRLATNVIMARLLFPEVFGVMTLVNIFVQGIQLFTDVGIGPSIIQSRRSHDPSFLDTAWTMQVVRGCAIWLCLLLIAWPASLFYEQPQLVALLPVVGLSAVIAGFSSTAIHTLNKQLALGRLTALEIGSQLAAIPVMALWAFFSPTIWALVAGALVSASVRAVVSHRLEKGHRNRFHWSRDAAQEVINFGKWIFVTTAIGFLAAQVDRLILGKLIPFETLGVYAIAFMLQGVPDNVLGALGFRVLFPAISQRIDRPRTELRDTIRRNRWPLLAALAVGVAAVACLGDLVVYVIYDDRYRSAGWMLQILALGLWPRMLANTMGPALLAIGQPRYIAYSTVVRFVFLAVAVPVGHAHAGMLGVVTVVALGSTTDYFIESYGLRRERLWLGAQDFWITLLWLGVIAGIAALRHAAGIPITEAPIPW